MASSHALLPRLLNTPDLAKIVPRLQPEVLHRVIQTCGLEDCADLVALTTPEQLTRILDADLWRARAPGSGEVFDVDRFGTWIAVLMDCGAAVAAEKLAGLHAGLAIAGLARHAAVFDAVAVSSYTTLDGELVAGRASERRLTAEIGGYLIEARRTAAWDAIVDLLEFLSAERPEHFHRLMRGCVRLSNGRREQDGFHELLDDAEQALFDLACDRENRRERQGFVAPEQARAFLRSARDLRLDAGRPAASAIAHAHVRAIHATPDIDVGTSHDSSDAMPEFRCAPASPADGAGAIEVLQEAGLLAAMPRALLGAGDAQASRLPFVEAYVSTDPAAAEALAFLANTLISGCSIQGRPFDAREAANGAAAICNLGLENWPPHWSAPDLLDGFQVGWTILHRDVGVYAAERLIDVLAAIRCGDREIQLRLDGLRRELIRSVRVREPWHARPALDAILMLDAVSWAALLALLDECPAIHAALGASRERRRSVAPADFAFVSTSRQIAAVREFMAALPSALT